MSAVVSMPAKPTMVTPEPGAALPDCLTERQQWVCWTYEYRAPKWTKLPRQTSGANAKSDTPSTWSTFAEVMAASDRRPDMGVGFVFAADDPFIGIDLDDCLTPDGSLKPWAAPILERFADTYAEVSPSGHGIKLWAQGSLAGLIAGTGTRRPCGDGQVEMYERGRFFTVTGKRFATSPLRVAEHQSDTQWLLAYIGAPVAACGATGAIPAAFAEEPTPAPEPEPVREPSIADAALLAKLEAFRAAMPKFAELWEGGVGFSGGRPDASAGDMSFCNLLAYHLGLNAREIDQAFRLSERMRRKWDEKHYTDGRTYGQATIAEAVRWATAERQKTAAPSRATMATAADGRAPIDSLNGLPMFAGAGVVWKRFEQSGDLVFGYTIDGKRVRWNSMADLLSFSKSQITIAKYLQVVIPTPPCAKGAKVKAIWEPIAQLMLKAAPIINAGEDLETEVVDLVAMAFRRAGSPVALSDSDGYRYMVQVREWRRDPYTRDGLHNGAIPPPCVFVWDGYVFVHAPTLRFWGSLPSVTNRSLSRSDVNRELQLLGFKFVRGYERKHEGNEVRLDMWRGPMAALGESQSELLKTNAGSAGCAE